MLHVVTSKKYSKPQITRHVQFHGSPGHRKDKIDAIQYAPQGLIDIQKIGLGFPYYIHLKCFGTHSGRLFGRHDFLEKLFAYKVRPATNKLPGKFETGTQNHEGIAGVLGAIEYFEWVGKEFGNEYAEGLSNYQS